MKTGHAWHYWQGDSRSSGRLRCRRTPEACAGRSSVSCSPPGPGARLRTGSLAVRRCPARSSTADGGYVRQGGRGSPGSTESRWKGVRARSGTTWRLEAAQDCRHPENGPVALRPTAGQVRMYRTIRAVGTGRHIRGWANSGLAARIQPSRDEVRAGLKIRRSVDAGRRGARARRGWAAFLRPCGAKGRSGSRSSASARKSARQMNAGQIKLGGAAPPTGTFTCWRKQMGKRPGRGVEPSREVRPVKATTKLIVIPHRKSLAARSVPPTAAGGSRAHPTRTRHGKPEERRPGGETIAQR